MESAQAPQGESPGCHSELISSLKSSHLFVASWAQNDLPNFPGLPHSVLLSGLKEAPENVGLFPGSPGEPGWNCSQDPGELWSLSPLLVLPAGDRRIV